MANKKISQLTAGAPAQETDLLPIDRSGANLSLQVSDILALAGAVPTGDSELVGVNAAGTALEALPGSFIDFTNGLLTLAPTGDGVALTIFGDSHSSDLQEWYLNGTVSPNWGMSIQPNDYSDPQAVLLWIQDSLSNYLYVEPSGFEFASGNGTGSYFSIRTSGGGFTFGDTAGGYFNTLSSAGTSLRDNSTVGIVLNQLNTGGNIQLISFAGANDIIMSGQVQMSCTTGPALTVTGDVGADDIVDLATHGGTVVLSVDGYGRLTSGKVGGTANKDLAGTVTIASSTTSIAYNYANTVLGTASPVVVFTPTSNPGAFYWVTPLGSPGSWTGFTLTIASAPGGNVTFNYVVIAQA